MSKPKILISGATGKTGSVATTALLEQGFSVRAFVHRKDARSEFLRNAGAEVVVGNLEDLSQLDTAMQGVQRAFFVCPWTPNQLDLALNFAVAAFDNKIEHIVALSQWLSHPTHPSVATRRTYLCDRMFEWLPDTSWTIINVGFFADNYMALLEPISQLGMLPLPLGDGKNAPISNEDIGRTVAGALASPDLHAGRVYRPIGPTLMSPQEIADAFGRVLQRRVIYQNISPKMFLKATKAMGMPTGLITQLQHYFEEYRLGAFEAGAPNDAVLHVTGREPEEFETIVARYAGSKQVTGLMPAVAQWTDTRRTLRNRIRAIRNFVGLLLTPAPNLDQYEHQHDYPSIGGSEYAMAAPAWTVLHNQPNAFGSNKDGQQIGSDVAPMGWTDGAD